MITGIGIDSIEIQRFAHWTSYDTDQLTKTFNKKEIKYCLSNPKKSAERFAARFAAREAFFKALSQIFPGHKIPFLTVCKNIYINPEENGNPTLVINWKKILENATQKPNNTYKSLVSITHTKTVATAIVMLQEM